MSRPLFSIVTPSFNQADYLETTIQSVLGQHGNGTEFDIEYFVIDGGSSDTSVDVIRQYEADLAGWCSEKDRGQTHAINKGFDKARGEIRAYINSDDFYVDGAFAAVARAFEDQPDTDLIHGTCRHVDGDGNHLRTQQGSIHNFTGMLDIWDEWLRPFDNRNFVQPEVFWTDGLAKRIGEFNETLHYTMDFEYWLRGFDAGMNVRCMDDVLACFRIHEAQKTTDQDRTRAELIEVIHPYLHRESDDRIGRDDRRRMLNHNALESYVMQSRDVSPRQRVAALVGIARKHPGLLRSRSYWRHQRRAAKSVFSSSFRHESTPAS